MRWNGCRALNKMEENCRNGYLMELIAYCRMAKQMRDNSTVRNGLAITPVLFVNDLRLSFPI